MHVAILPQTLLPSRLPRNIEQSSLCYPVGPCWLSILNIAVCTSPTQMEQDNLNVLFNAATYNRVGVMNLEPKTYDPPYFMLWLGS